MKRNFKEGIQTNEKKRTLIEITKSNSSCRTNHFKVSRITAKFYKKESGKNLTKIRLSRLIKDLLLEIKSIKFIKEQIMTLFWHH